jgi:hypothetical protein
MITINLNINATKNILKLALLATLIYLLSNITNNYNITTIKFQSTDTLTSAPDYYLK